MSGLSQEVLETINNPDVIVKGSKNELMAIKEFKGKSLIVVYKEVTKEDGFVITAFLTVNAEKIKRRGIVWKRGS